MSTAMPVEICLNCACPTMPASGAPHTLDKAAFFVTILGNNDFAKDLAVQYAAVINTRYTLNCRYLRAYWINPGYE